MVKKIFAKQSNTGHLGIDKNQNPTIEESIKTYQVTDKKNKFIVTQLFRKNQKPRRIKTITKSKTYKTHDDVIDAIQTNKIKIKTRDSFKYNNGTEVIQTNYISKIKQYPQLMGLVHVHDRKTGRSLLLVGYSNKIRGLKPSKKQMARAEKEVMQFAQGKYTELNGIKTSYKDNKRFQSKILETRFVYIKLKR